MAAGTSALREAGNGARFAAAAALRYGLNVAILTGEDEAHLAYDGARSRAGEQPARVGVIDLGGGSAKVAMGDEVGCRRSEYSEPAARLSPARPRARRQRRSGRARYRAGASPRPPRSRRRHSRPSSGLRSARLALERRHRSRARWRARRPAWRRGFDACPRSGYGAICRPRQAREPDWPGRGSGAGSRLRPRDAVAPRPLSDELGAPAVRVTAGGLREGLLLREIGGTSTRHARVHFHDAGRLRASIRRISASSKTSHSRSSTGAKIGVIGGNGTGKSTLLRILAGADKDFLGEAHAAPGHPRRLLRAGAGARLGGHRARSRRRIGE